MIIKYISRATAILGAAFMLSAFAGESICNNAVAVSYDPQAMADMVLVLVNEEREAQGLEPLLTAPILTDIAEVRTNELLELFSHYRPDGTICYTALDEFGIDYNFAGENIAAGNSTPETVVEQWMESDGHRENILSADYDYIGIYVVYSPDSDYGWYWTQIFINSDAEFDGAYRPIRYYDIIPVCDGDLNGDCEVDIFDVQLLRAYIESPVEANFNPLQENAADLDKNGNIDYDDLLLLNNAVTNHDKGV